MSHKTYCSSCGRLVIDCGLADDHAVPFEASGSCGSGHPLIHYSANCGGGKLAMEARQIEEPAPKDS